MDHRGYFSSCYQAVTPNQAAMVNLVNSIKKFCKKQGIQAAKDDKCSAYWIENDCYLSFDKLQHKVYNLGNNKQYKAKFDIPDAPCERKLILPEIKKGKTCSQSAYEHIAQHIQSGFERFQNRVSSVNCLADDEYADNNLDVALLFMKWSKKCNIPINKFNVWSIGIHACPTMNKSITRNIEKITRIAEKANKFCIAQAGTGKMCEVESKKNECLSNFTFLNRRVYQLANKKTFSLNLVIKRSDVCISASEKCLTGIKNKALAANKACHATHTKNREDSIKASPWTCDHYNKSTSDCFDIYNRVISKNISKCGSGRDIQS